MWLSSIDYAWNNCVVYDGFYLPFWRELILDLAQRARPTLNLPLGAHYERFLPAKAYSAQIRVETPSGRRESVALKRVGEEELFHFVYPAEEREGLQESGLYSVERPEGSSEGLAGKAREYFTASLAVSEGDLARFGGEDLGEGLGVPVQEVRPPALRDLLRQDGGVGGGKEFWRQLLGLLILFLVLESSLAAFLGRRRR